MNEAERQFSNRLKLACDNKDVAPANAGRGEWIANAINVKSSTVSRWLAGLGIPQRANMQKLADALGVDVNWLERGVKPEGHLDSHLLAACLGGAFAALADNYKAIADNPKKLADILTIIYERALHESLGAKQTEEVSKMSVFIRYHLGDEDRNDAA